MNLLKKFQLLIVIVLTTPLLLNAQSKNLGSWLTYLGNQKINDKWTLQSDIQYRNYQIASQRNQLLLRAGIGYHLTPNNHTILMGIAYIETDAYDNKDNLIKNTIEQRVYQQYQYKQNIKKLGIQHRLRFEQRFIEKNVDLRSRYFLAVNMPLKGNSINKNIYASLYNELFVNINNIKFDRNRLFGGLGYGFNNNLKIEVGYMIQAQKTITRNQIQLFIINNLPL